MRRVFILVLFLCSLGLSNDIPQSKIDDAVNALVAIASDAKLIALVEQYNANPPKEYANMTNESWAKLSTRDPLVKNLTQNEGAKLLRSRIAPYVSEAFLSGANGKKISILSKTSTWDHTGKPKHDIPMTGKTWVGAPELDKSSGVNQFQISAPVFQNNKPIGSLVFGVAIVKLN